MKLVGIFSISFWLFLVLSVVSSLKNAPENMWIKSSTYRGQWGGVASDATGASIIATKRGDGIYRSRDHGATWKSINSQTLQWGKITSDSTGERLAAICWQVGILVSVNAGIAWTVTLSREILSWNDIWMSNSGKYVYAASGLNGGLFISSNFGLSWTQSFAEKSISAVTSTGDGFHVYASLDGLYSSIDHGITWTLIPAPQVVFSSLSTSFNGRYITAAGGQYVFQSNDFGTTWISLGFGDTDHVDYPQVTFMSKSGKNQILCGQHIYKSVNYGVSFINTNAEYRHWLHVTCDEHGDYCVASDGFHLYSYISTDPLGKLFNYSTTTITTTDVFIPWIEANYA